MNPAAGGSALNPADGRPGMNPAVDGSAVSRLRTASLRRRVTVSGVLVLTAVVLLLAVVTDLLFGAQSNRELRATLQDRARLADQLAHQRTDPREIVARVETPIVKIRLTTPSGMVFGSAGPPPEPSQPGGLGPRQVYRAGNDLVSMRRLPGGRELVLVADGDAASNAQRRLRRVLIIVGLAAIAVAALVLTGTVRVALAPLDAMTALAKSITRGDRGRRLAPDRPQTELGRAARAFDDMLDALEGAERQARQAEAQARQAESVARTSEGRTRRFVADAAHELRTPIAGVQAAAEAVLQAGPATDTHERERLQLLIIREAHRAGRLVEDLLSLARIDAGLELHREPVDLLTLAATEADRTRLLAPSLTVAVTGEPVLVTADPQRLAQVLANLLDNARRHTPDGGRIDVHVTSAGPWAELTVTDTGPGVPPADRERIFDRLVRLDHARSHNTGGAGLGLAIARGIARAHGGGLRCVDPPPGAGGARFALDLPLSPETATVPIPSPA
jgi:two-component system, OmpR family, sensor kinase